jgi:serine/threonine protein kinase
MEPYGHAVDWWSLGVVACCMLSGQVGSKKQTCAYLLLVLRSVVLIVPPQTVI